MLGQEWIATDQCQDSMTGGVSKVSLLNHAQDQAQKLVTKGQEDSSGWWSQDWTQFGGSGYPSRP